MPEHPTAKTVSSADLKTRVVNFVGRAEEILTHPLAADAGSFKINVTYNTTTGEVAGIDFDSNNMPSTDLFFLATQMRPIIFTDTDPISFLRLISRIEFEHPYFRGKFKPLRDGLKEWKATLLIAASELKDETLPPGTSATTLAVGPPGTPPPGVDIDKLKTDSYFANVYFNAQLWHSDTDKAAEYQAASPSMQKHIAKCAELRVLGAVPLIDSLHHWIVEVRSLGLDI